jgi:hypothetical protein
VRITLSQLGALKLLVKDGDVGGLVAESWQERKKTRKTRKADAEARAAKNMRLVARARAAGKLPAVGEDVLARVRAAGKSSPDNQKVAAKSPSASDDAAAKSPLVKKAVGKPSHGNEKLVAKARPAKTKRKKLPAASPKKQESWGRRKERDAEYRKALGLGSGDKLPTQLGNTTSGGGGRDRAKAARPTRKGGDVQFARRARLIG